MNKTHKNKISSKYCLTKVVSIRIFGIDLLWNQNPKGDFKTIENKSKKIKK